MFPVLCVFEIVREFGEVVGDTGETKLSFDHCFTSAMKGGHFLVMFDVPKDRLDITHSFKVDSFSFFSLYIEIIILNE